MLKKLTNDQLDKLHRRIAKKWRTAPDASTARFVLMMYRCSDEWRRRGL